MTGKSFITYHTKINKWGQKYTLIRS